VWGVWAPVWAMSCGGGNLGPVAQRVRGGGGKVVAGVMAGRSQRSAEPAGRDLP